MAELGRGSDNVLVAVYLTQSLQVLLQCSNSPLPLMVIPYQPKSLDNTHFPSPNTLTHSLTSMASVASSYRDIQIPPQSACSITASTGEAFNPTKEVTSCPPPWSFTFVQTAAFGLHAPPTSLTLASLPPVYILSGSAQKKNFQGWREARQWVAEPKVK